MLTMPAKTTEFAIKLNALMGDRTKAEVARACRVSPQQFQNYLDGSGPRPHTALLMARFLNVDPVWFMDEDQPWREDYPRYNYRPGCYLTDTQLLNEVALRFQLRAHWFNDLMDQLDAVDWDKVWSMVEALEPGDELPDELRDVAFALQNRGHFPHVTPKDFDPGYMLKRDVDLGGRERIDPEIYDFRAVSDRAVEQRHALPKLELTLSRLFALNLIRGNAGERSPEQVPDLSPLRKTN